MSHNRLQSALQSGTGKQDQGKRISLSRIHAGDEGELLKFIMIVKPDYIKSELGKKGFLFENKEDYLILPKIMKLGLDKKGLENSKGKIVVFDLRKMLKSAPMSKGEIKGSGIMFVR